MLSRLLLMHPFSPTAVLLKARLLLVHIPQLTPQAPTAIPSSTTRLQTTAPSAAAFTTAVFRMIHPARSAAHITPSALTQTVAVAPFLPSGLSISEPRKPCSLPPSPLRKDTTHLQAGTTAIPRTIARRLSRKTSL